MDECTIIIKNNNGFCLKCYDVPKEDVRKVLNILLPDLYEEEKKEEWPAMRCLECEHTDVMGAKECSDCMIGNPFDAEIRAKGISNFKKKEDVCIKYE